jgi:hypothetical protein
MTNKIKATWYSGHCGIIAGQEKSGYLVQQDRYCKMMANVVQEEKTLFIVLQLDMSEDS